MLERTHMRYVINQLFLMALFNFYISQSLAAPYQIALTQIISHPSLDRIRKGILDELVDQKIIHSDHREVLFQNAQGNIVIAAQIAQQFVTMRPKVIVAISTSSAQTVKNAVKNNSIPIIFSGVTDPVEAGLVSSIESMKERITGTIDFPSAQAQIALIKKVIPDIRILGIIYNPSETNSKKQVMAIKDAAKKFNLNIEESIAFKTSEVHQATIHLIDKVDALLLPNDNTIISALPTIASLCQKERTPIFASDPESINHGAIAALANNQYEVGRITGNMVADILKGKDIKSLNIKIIHKEQLYINDKLFAVYGLKKPHPSSIKS